MKQKQRTKQFLEDVTSEGKDEVYLDIDRMVNEGLAGGHVLMREDSTNIEQSTDFFEESPPN